MTTATKAGQAGLQGWRRKVADGVAEPISERSRLNEDQIRALIGATFLMLSLIYVVKSGLALAREARGR
jgi:hypothetical protein